MSISHLSRDSVVSKVIALPVTVREQEYASLASADYQKLVEAVRYLEKPNLAVRLSNYIGMPVEKAFASLPEGLGVPITRLTREALSRALDIALMTLPTSETFRPIQITHKFLVGLSGALGGSFGIAGLAIELPLSATLMLRAIAAIARELGEDLNNPEAKLACMEVFALGSGSKAGNAAEIGYYAVRAFLSKTLEESAKHLIKKGLTKEGAPALVKFIEAVARRFSIQVTQKLALQTLPALGAASGAAVNLIFMEHFQSTARAHFTIRHLERVYGRHLIQQAYEALRKA